VLLLLVLHIYTYELITACIHSYIEYTSRDIGTQTKVGLLCVCVCVCVCVLGSVCVCWVLCGFVDSHEICVDSWTLMKFVWIRGLS
jgi:hypothetical protein